MGQEEEEKAVRGRPSRATRSTPPLMTVAHPAPWCSTACPPTGGEEITAEVFEHHANEIFDEAENRLHAQKAVMYLLMGGKRQ